jgi:hypothetical protein
MMPVPNDPRDLEMAQFIQLMANILLTLEHDLNNQLLAKDLFVSKFMQVFLPPQIECREALGALGSLQSDCSVSR